MVVFPSRGRFGRWLDSVHSITQNVYDPTKVYLLNVFDDDDPEMRDCNVYLKNMLGLQYHQVGGTSTSKINAINRGMEHIPDKFQDWDIVVVMSDDMRFCADGWDELIRIAMKAHFPDTDGYLHFLEKDSLTALNVMTIKGREYYKRFNFLYHPDYLSLFCDNEQMQVAKMLGKYAYIGSEIIKHLNPAYGYLPKDQMFLDQQDIGYGIDEQTYFRRKAMNFEIEKWKRPYDK